MFLGDAADQRRGVERTHFFVGVDQEGDAAVVLEVHRLQDLERVQPGDHAALVVHHAGAVGAAVLDVEGLGLRHAVGEHRVDVRHQQDLAGAGALEGRDHVGAGMRRRRKGLDLSAQLLQLFDHHAPHLLEACGVGRAGVDVDQAFEQQQRFVLVAGRAVEDLLVGLGMKRGHQHGGAEPQHDSCKSHRENPSLNREKTGEAGV